jgi:excisionase family DNA binding protein
MTPVAEKSNSKPLEFGDLPRLVTVKVAAQYLGLTDSQVRALVTTNRIARTPIGARIMIPREALDEFIALNTVQPCHGETQDPGSAFSKNVSASTSFGAKTDAAASAQRALQIAGSRKQRCLTSSKSAAGTRARVIPVKSL